VLESRLDALLAEKGVVRFQREPWANPRTGQVEPMVLGERPDLRFLVARDEWDRTFAPLLLEPNVRLEYGGFPVEPDDSLSAGSIVLV
jgi:hypothetical protein